MKKLMILFLLTSIASSTLATRDYCDEFYTNPKTGREDLTHVFTNAKYEAYKDKPEVFECQYGFGVHGFHDPLLMFKENVEPAIDRMGHPIGFWREAHTGRFKENYFAVCEPPLIGDYKKCPTMERL